MDGKKKFVVGVIGTQNTGKSTFIKDILEKFKLLYETKKNKERKRATVSPPTLPRKAGTGMRKASTIF